MSNFNYDSVFEYVENTYWPIRKNIEKLGGVYTVEPFAYSATGVRTKLRCNVNYDGSELTASFEELVPGEALPLLDITVSPKLFGIKIEQVAYEKMFEYSPDYLIAAISQTVAEHTNEESDKLLYEANEKSQPDKFLYSMEMLEYCKMIPYDECDYIHGLTGHSTVIFQNGGLFDIMHAYNFGKNVPSEHALRDSEGNIVVFDNGQAALEALNILVPEKYLKPGYAGTTTTPITARFCSSLQDVGDNINQGLENYSVLQKSLIELGYQMLENNI